MAACDTVPKDPMMSSPAAGVGVGMLLEGSVNGEEDYMGRLPRCLQDLAKDARLKVLAPRNEISLSNTVFGQYVG